MASLDNTATLTFKVSIAWWLRLYIYTLVILCHFTGMEPKWDRVNYWINRGVKVKVV